MIARFLLYYALRTSSTPISYDKKVERYFTTYLKNHVNKNIAYRLINKFIIPDQYGYSHLIDHVIINNHSIFAIKLVDIKGEIEVDKEGLYWKYNEQEVFNPIKEIDELAKYLKDIFQGIYEVSPLVIFLRNNAPKGIKDNVINMEEAPKYLDTFYSEREYSRDEVIHIYKTLLHLYNKQPSLVEHKDNVSRFNRLIKNRICPFCGEKIYEEKEDGVTHLTCSSYPLCKFNIVK